jgi:hypothetical protein
LKKERFHKPLSVCNIKNFIRRYTDNRIKNSDFVPVNIVRSRSLLSNPEAIIDNHIKLGILETDGRYIVDEKSIFSVVLFDVNRDEL